MNVSILSSLHALGSLSVLSILSCNKQFATMSTAYLCNSHHSIVCMYVCMTCDDVCSLDIETTLVQTDNIPSFPPPQHTPGLPTTCQQPQPLFSDTQCSIGSHGAMQAHSHHFVHGAAHTRSAMNTTNTPPHRGLCDPLTLPPHSDVMDHSHTITATRDSWDTAPN